MHFCILCSQQGCPRAGDSSSASRQSQMMFFAFSCCSLPCRSYLTPVRDEEAESLRKARSRQARQTRRSTQVRDGGPHLHVWVGRAAVRGSTAVLLNGCLVRGPRLP